MNYNAYDMYHLEEIPGVKGAFTYAFQKRAAECYGLDPTQLYFDKVTQKDDTTIFVIKHASILQNNEKTGYFYWTGKKVTVNEALKELKVPPEYWHRVVYFDYYRKTFTLDDGTTLYMDNNKLYKLTGAPISKEVKARPFFSTQYMSYYTITGCEEILVKPGEIVFHITHNYNRTITLNEFLVLLKAKTPEDVMALLRLL